MVLNNKVPSHIPLSPNPDGPQKLSELLDMDVTQVDRTDLDKQYAIKYNSNPAKRGRFWELVEVQGGGGTPATQVQSDWDEVDTNSPAYILNKPDIPSDSSDAITFDWNIEDETYSEFVARTGIESFKGRKDVYLRGQTDFGNDGFAVIDSGTYDMQGIRFIGDTSNFDSEGVFGVAILCLDGVTVNKLPDLENILFLSLETICRYNNIHNSKSEFVNSIISSVGALIGDYQGAMVEIGDDSTTNQLEFLFKNSVVVEIEGPSFAHYGLNHSGCRYILLNNSKLSNSAIDADSGLSNPPLMAYDSTSSLGNLYIEHTPVRISEAKRVGFDSSLFVSNNVHDALEELVGQGGSGGDCVSYVWSNQYSWHQFVEQNIDKRSQTGPTSEYPPINIYLENHYGYGNNQPFYIDEAVMLPYFWDRVTLIASNGNKTEHQMNARVIVTVPLGFAFLHGDTWSNQGFLRNLRGVTIEQGFSGSMFEYTFAGPLIRHFDSANFRTSDGQIILNIESNNGRLEFSGQISVDGDGGLFIKFPKNGWEAYLSLEGIGHMYLSRIGGGPETSGDYGELEITITGTNYIIYDVCPRGQTSGIEADIYYQGGRYLRNIQSVGNHKGSLQLDNYGLSHHFVESLKFWAGTEDEYDNVVTKDDNTLYFIIEE